MLGEIVGRRVKVESESQRLRPEASEVNRLVADNRCIRELTGWRSKVPFRVGLEHTVKWIERNLSHFSPDRYAQ
jgi:nucleoside-diphosphate-sugar epimerase